MVMKKLLTYFDSMSLFLLKLRKTASGPECVSLRILHSVLIWFFFTESSRGFRPFRSLLLVSAPQSLIRYCTTSVLPLSAARCSGVWMRRDMWKDMRDVQYYLPSKRIKSINQSITVSYDDAYCALVNCLNYTWPNVSSLSSSCGRRYVMTPTILMNPL